MRWKDRRWAALALVMASAPAGSAAAADYRAYGIASWYGDELAGSRTASGARFDPAGSTAAHRSLPLGSFVAVTAVDSGRSILVMINDRGPGRHDRLIDLSRAAAQRLGFGKRALAAVRIQAVVPTVPDAARVRAGGVVLLRAGATLVRSALAALPPIMNERRYMLQIATFSSEARARKLAAALAAEVVPAGDRWRVRRGPLTGAAAIHRARDAVAGRGYGDVQVLPAD